MNGSFLLAGATLVDPVAGTLAPGDCLVLGRRIAALGRDIDPPAGVPRFAVPARLRLAPALIDGGAFAPDIEASAAGGVATCVLMPDREPPLDQPALVEHALRIGKPRLWVRPLAAATRGLAGLELAELALMREAGALGAATGRSAIADPAVMLRLLRYAAGLDMLVVSHAEDAALVRGSVATEGEFATRLGLAAAPAAAEALAIHRDVRLAAEAGARLHIACVTTGEGAALVREAKARGLPVTAGTSPPYLWLQETALMGWRSFARLSPPLRSEEDRLALLEAVADGTIDCIVSRHDPRTQDDKRRPFAEAAPGAAGASLLLPLVLALAREGVVDEPRALALATARPAAIFGVEGGRLEPGAPADLLLYDADAPWRIEADRLPGLGSNTPFDGLPTAGRPLVLWKGGERVWGELAGAAAVW